MDITKWFADLQFQDVILYWVKNTDAVSMKSINPNFRHIVNYDTITYDHRR
jgi:hypothetical protein